jgi:hypothetical protein
MGPAKIQPMRFALKDEIKGYAFAEILINLASSNCALTGFAAVGGWCNDEPPRLLKPSAFPADNRAG